MEVCIKLLHAIEYIEEKEGVMYFRCIPCNKVYPQFNDCCAGR